MSTPGRPAQDLNWLITNFVERVPDVAHAVVVSSDGLPLAFSAGFPQERADQLAAVTSGLTSLTQGASRVFEGGAVVQTVVEMQRGVLVIMAISNGSSLAVLAASTCDLGLVAYEMTLLVERAGRVLTPATRSVMQAAQSQNQYPPPPQSQSQYPPFPPSSSSGGQYPPPPQSYGHYPPPSQNTGQASGQYAPPSGNYQYGKYGNRSTNDD
jgi:predicted regulator of Ras-like GTPase activity (Roadblock/LC7/MglB family)